MREPITLFGFEVRPLTLGQVENLEALMLAPFEAGDPAKPLTGVRLARAVLKIARLRDHAAIDVETIECDLASLGEAQSMVLRLGGFMLAGETSAAADPNAPNGGGSAAG